MSRQLFILGCGRSGTTALTDYLNDHPQICICVERYKFIPKQVKPELFVFERILDYSAEETNLPKASYQTLLARKEESSLRLIGDKVPSYFKHLNVLATNNPQAMILFTYRPLEAVAASYLERSRNPNDTWLGNKDGIALALRDWNAANMALKRFVSKHPGFPIMVVSYDDFFARPGQSARMLGAFLGFELGADIVSGWRTRNSSFNRNRASKALTSEERERIERGRERDVEEWVLGYLAAQKRLLMQAGWGSARKQPSKTLPIKRRIKKLLREARPGNDPWNQS